MDKKRLKILFLSRYVGTVNRGVETYVLELSKRLAEKHDVSLYTGRDSDSIKLLLKGDFDIVIPTNGRWQSLKASLISFFKGYKTVIPGQAGIGRDDIWNIFIARPDVYVALTEIESQWARNWALGVKIVKIPNGVDLNRFNPTSKKADIHLKRPLILSVGALEWYKYHERTIDALSTLKEGSLLIIGSGKLEKELRARGEKLLGKNRFNIIQVSFKEIADYYRAADLFVLPSWNRESFGIVYLEALACNVPVVAPNDLSRKEIVGDAGILVEVSNNVEYAEAIEKTLSLSWGNKPRKQAEKFSWDKIAQQYENLFAEIT